MCDQIEALKFVIIGIIEINSKLEVEKNKLLEIDDARRKTNAGQRNKNLDEQILNETKANTDELKLLFSQKKMEAQIISEREQLQQIMIRELKQKVGDLQERLRAVESERVNNQFGISTTAGNPLLEDDDGPRRGPVRLGAEPKQDLDRAIDEDDFFNEGGNPPAPKNNSSMPWDKQNQMLDDKPVLHTPVASGNQMLNHDDDDDFFGGDAKPQTQAPPARPSVIQPGPQAHDDDDFFGEDVKPQAQAPPARPTAAPPVEVSDFFGDSSKTFLS